MEDLNARLGSRASQAWGGSESGSRGSKNSRRTPSSVQQGDEVMDLQFMDLQGSFSGSDSSDDSLHAIPGGSQVVKNFTSEKRTSEKRTSRKRSSAGSIKRISVKRPSTLKGVQPAVSSEEDDHNEEGYWVYEEGAEEEEEKAVDEMETSSDDWPQVTKSAATHSNITQPPPLSSVNQAQRACEAASPDPSRTSPLAGSLPFSSPQAQQNLTPSGSSSGLSGLGLPLDSDGSSSPQLGGSQGSRTGSKEGGGGKEKDSSLGGEDMVDAALRSVLEEHAPLVKSTSDYMGLPMTSSTNAQLTEAEVRGDHWGQGRPSLVKKEHSIDRLVVSIRAAMHSAEQRMLRSVWADICLKFSLMKKEQPLHKIFDEPGDAWSPMRDAPVGIEAHPLHHAQEPHTRAAASNVGCSGPAVHGSANQTSSPVVASHSGISHQITGVISQDHAAVPTSRSQHHLWGMSHQIAGFVSQDHAAVPASRSHFPSVPATSHFRSTQPSDGVCSLQKRMADLRDQLHRLSTCNDGLEKIASGCKPFSTAEVSQAHVEAMGQAQKDLKLALTDDYMKHNPGGSIQDASCKDEMHHLSELHDYVTRLKTKPKDEPSSFQFPVLFEPPSTEKQRVSSSYMSTINNRDNSCSEKAISDVWARFHPSRGGQSSLWSQPAGPAFATHSRGQLQLPMSLTASTNSGYPVQTISGVLPR